MSEAKKKTPSRIERLYAIDFQKGTIQFKNRRCPRCGSVMGQHSVPVKRWTCGSCSYTDLKSAKT